MTNKLNPKLNPHLGLISALTAFLLWGSLPLYWKLLEEVPALEVLCHRMVWSSVFLFTILLITKRLGPALQIYKNKKLFFTLVLTGILIACNWLTYIYAVLSGKVIEASLGYFINPLLTILIGIIFLKEKGDLATYIAIGLASLGVAFQIMVIGHIPLIALALGFSFAIYGALRKVAVVEALPGLFVETTVGLIPCLGYLLWLQYNGTGSFNFDKSREISLLLMSAGAVTTLPLLAFTYGARRMRLTTLGLLQYSSPFITFMLGVFVFKEPFSTENLFTFACIWAALIVYTLGSQLQSKKEKRKLKASCKAVSTHESPNG